MKPFVRLLLFAVSSNIFQNMVHPVTPTLITELGFADYMFGAMYAMMAIGMLLMSPVWGRLSDKYGRRLSYALGGLIYLAGQILFFYGRQEVLVLAARLLAGLGASGPLVALTACAVDLTDENNRASRLSVYAAICTVSCSLGYFLGGMLGTLSLPHVFITQFIMLGLNSLLAVFFLPDTPKRASSAQVSKGRRFSPREALGIMTVPLMLFLACVALANLGTCGYDNTFNYYIKRELDFPSSYNGIIKAVTGLLGMVATLGVGRMLVRRFAVDKTLCLTLGACALSLGVSMTMRETVPFIAFNMVFYLFNAMYQPMLQSLMTRASDCDFGLLSGLYNSARSLGMIVGSLAAGFLYTLSPLAPFSMQVICFALAALTALLFSRHIARAAAR